MRGRLFAERAVLVQSQPIGIVLLILERIIIAVLTFRTFERNLYS